MGWKRTAAANGWLRLKMMDLFDYDYMSAVVE
jgi:hypothetical protein